MDTHDLCNETQRQRCLTVFVCLMVLEVEACLFQHSQENDSSNPELDTKQILPVKCREDEPQSRQEKVVQAHESIELQHWKVLSGQEPIGTLKFDVDRSIEVFL